MQVLDAYTHVLPPQYFDRIDTHLKDGRGNPEISSYYRWFADFPALTDLDARWRAVAGIDDYRQIVMLGVPPIEDLGSPAECAELARLANDELAQMADDNPDRIAGFAAGLAFNDVEASVIELERAVKDLGALGFQMYTNIAGRPVDDPLYEPILAKAAELKAAIWLHPTRGAGRPDYETEDVSRFGMWWSIAWPYESTLAMCRLVYSGAFERYPDLHVITHHGGAMVPQFAGRLDRLAVMEPVEPSPLTSPVLDHFKKFYADTVLGRPAALASSADFFGTGQMLFASDMPYGAPTVVHNMKATVETVFTDTDELAQVLSGNASRLFARD